MKKFGSKAGFTLVELIVVIAILGILAAVAVPAYSGYMDKAKEAADMQTLSSIATAVQGTAAGHNVTITDITVTNTNGSGSYSVSGTGWTYNNEVDALLGNTTLSFQGKWDKAIMKQTDGSWGWTLTYPTT